MDEHRQLSFGISQILRKVPPQVASQDMVCVRLRIESVSIASRTPLIEIEEAGCPAILGVVADAGFGSPMADGYNAVFSELVVGGLVKYRTRQ